MMNIGSSHPAIVDDQAFFSANPDRRYRARPFVQGEVNLPSNVALFSVNDFGQTGEINFVILKRIKGGRLRRHFHKSCIVRLDSDRKIVAFLSSNRISRHTLTIENRL